MNIDRAPLGRVVAIANGKGGVGKTSLATTLAGLAAKAGYRILLIDLDPQGNVGEDLGYTGAGTGDDGAGLVASLASKTPLVVTLPQTRSGVDVICGGERLDDDDAHPSSPELLIENPHLVASSTLAGGRP